MDEIVADNPMGGVEEFGGFGQGDFMLDDDAIPEEMLVDED
jgi:hypothetical protein